MRLRVEAKLERSPGVIVDFVARDRWRNHPSWDPSVIEMILLERGPIRAGRRARVRRKSGDELLEVLEFERDRRWLSRSQLGQLSLEMIALIEPAEEAASGLTLIEDTLAGGAVRDRLPVLAPVFYRRMRVSAARIEEMVERQSPSP